METKKCEACKLSVLLEQILMQCLVHISLVQLYVEPDSSLDVLFVHRFLDLSLSF